MHAKCKIDSLLNTDGISNAAGVREGMFDVASFMNVGL